MYQGGMVAKQEAEKRADAQMMGEQPIQNAPIEEAPNRVCRDCMPTFPANLSSPLNFVYDVPSSASL